MRRSYAFLAFTLGWLLATRPALAEEVPALPASRAWVAIVVAVSATAAVVLVNIMSSKRGRRE